ncbi:MAG: hypothetical protein GXO87_14745 [Chlorobi bacterium]|nr:hypothetical protein [Chlorobiota bacterium]
MSAVRLTEALKKEYASLFRTVQIRTDKLNLINPIVTKIANNKDKYEAVGNLLNIPWYFIAVIHSMESGLSFDKHLHNGDPLSGRTVHVPAGRPADGNPPFTWEASAVDSLKFSGLHRWTDWTIPGLLYKLEAYNGFGYRTKHPEVLSPYLWSFSNHYARGKYVADGRWSDGAVSRQCGAAVLLRRLSERGIITFPDDTSAFDENKPFLRYSKKRIKYGRDLQIFLNQFPGVRLLVDGKPGNKTSEAFKKITGYYLKGDTRNEIVN